MSALEELEQLDSGMGSSVARSPDLKSLLTDNDDEDDSDEEDESLSERLLGLTEMFPEKVRNIGFNVGTNLCSCVKGLYAFTCTATWLIISSSTILFAPIVFEIERAQMDELQRNQQKQLLLGPSAAMANTPVSSLPVAPPVPR